MWDRTPKSELFNRKLATKLTNNKSNKVFSKALVGVEFEFRHLNEEKWTFTCENTKVVNIGFFVKKGPSDFTSCDGYLTPL